MASMVIVLFRFFFGSSETAILSNTILFSKEPEKKQELVRSPAHSSGRHILARKRSHCKLIKTITVCKHRTEKRLSKLGRCLQTIFYFKYEILKRIDSFPFTLSEQKEIKSTDEVREDFCIKIIHKGAYFLDPREQGRLLNDDDRVAAMEFVCELANNCPLAKCWM